MGEDEDVRRAVAALPLGDGLIGVAELFRMELAKWSVMTNNTAQEAAQKARAEAQAAAKEKAAAKKAEKERKKNEKKNGL